MLDVDAKPRPRVPDRLRGQIFRGSDAVAEGLISASRLRREYTRILHGIYAPPGIRVDHGIRTLAALLLMPSTTVLTAHSAAWWYGVPHAEPLDPVMLILAPEIPAKGVRGIRLHVCELAEAEINLVNGLRLASPLRCAWDAATLTAPRNALATVDGLLRRGVVTQPQLLDHVSGRAGVWGVTRARPVFELANGLSESPGESWTRWLLHAESLPPAALQHEVFDEEGRFVARVDFAWPAKKIALEYDGSYHADPVQQAADRSRDAALARLGWTVVHMTSSDLHDFTRVGQRLRSLLAS